MEGLEFCTPLETGAIETHEILERDSQTGNRPALRRGARIETTPLRFLARKSNHRPALVALQSNLDKSARSKLDRSGSWEMEDYERERTMFGRAMEEGEVAV